jgi:tetratricopeptide (TPR) repeat protein
VSIGLALTRALAHLHGHGLVHRDIKPSNIIFVDGAPKVADIGLVTGIDATRSFVGTDGYIAPEGPGTPQADLYSLGKVLFEMSTGKDRQDFPELPTEWRTSAERERLLEFNEVVLKACDCDVHQRYSSARQMESDLVLLQRGQSVKRKRAADRRWTFAKKAAIMAAVGTILTIGLVWLRHSRPKALDPLTTGKNVGGYPPTAMRGTTNKEAWDHYRLGYFAHRRKTEEGEEQAILHLNRAIALDPKFTLAYATLWRAKFMDTWLLTHAESDEFRRLADKLVALDNGLAETHHVLGFIRFMEWKWPEAEAEYREALRLNPDCVPAWILLGFQLSHLGRTDEALQVLDRGLQLDPNEPQLVKMKGHAYFVRRQFQSALGLYLESARREPLFANSHLFAARAYVALTNYPAAIDELERTDLLQGRAPDETKQEHAELRRAFEEDGAQGFWRKRLDLRRAALKPEEEPYAFAQTYAWLGEKEQALTFLEKALRRHDELVYLIFDECWDPWRDEPRFEAIRKKIGMPRHPNFPAR